VKNTVGITTAAGPTRPRGYQIPEEFAQRSLAAASATLQQPEGCALSPKQQTTNKGTKTNIKFS